VTICQLRNWFTRRTSRQGSSHTVEMAASREKAPYPFSLDDAKSRTAIWTAGQANRTVSGDRRKGAPVCGTGKRGRPGLGQSFDKAPTDRQNSPQSHAVFGLFGPGRNCGKPGDDMAMI
jgi:hypothetical protein